MKTTLIIIFIFLGWSLQAQLVNPKDLAKRKATDRTNSSIDRNIDKGLDKIEEGIGSLFKKKEKSSDDTSKHKKESTKETSDEPSTNQNQEEVNSNTESGWSDGTTEVSTLQREQTVNESKPKFAAYSKFDFLSGEKIVAYEDFSQDAIGDFPDKWNTNAGGELVTIAGVEGKWLKASEKGIFYPEYVNKLPENFTVEFDMMISEDVSEMQSGLLIYFPEVSSRKLTFDVHFSDVPQIGFDLHPIHEGQSSSSVWVFSKDNEKLLENTIPIKWNVGEVNRVSIWRQKNRIRLYINENKVWDLPRAFDPSLTYSLHFANNLWGGANYISNVRIAEGLPDTRNKLLTEGKFVTQGILFDVNSDKIKAESYGILKEIGNVLKESPALKVKIIGHTDSDGDETKNLDLSKRRAASVKKMLADEFGIDASRLETDGKGESQPLESNKTSQGKASNRRVEFLKL